MARERSPERDKAKQMWLESSGNISNRQIAEQLGIDEKKVAVWKQRDKWNVVLGHPESVVQQTEMNVVQQKRPGAPKGNRNAAGNRSGAPPGNKRAVGNRGGSGGPEGNKKAVTTGEHETIWMDTLTESEQLLIDQVDTDPIIQANESLYLLTIRERRMMQQIKALTDGLSEKERSVLYELKAIKEVGILHDEKSGITKKIPHSRNEMVESRIEEKEYRKLDDILRLEEALTRSRTRRSARLI